MKVTAFAVRAGEDAHDVAGETAPAADAVGDHSLLVGVGAERRVTDRGSRVPQADVLDEGPVARPDPGDLHEGLGPGVGAAAVGSPGEPQYAVVEGGSGHAGIGALEPVAVVGGPGHVVAAVPGGEVGGRPAVLGDPEVEVLPPHEPLRGDVAAFDLRQGEADQDRAVPHAAINVPSL